MSELKKLSYYIKDKRCSIPCNLVYRFLFGLSFGNFRNFDKKNGGIDIDEPPQGPRMIRSTVYETLHSVRVLRCCTNSSGSYLIVNVSTPVFINYSIIMSNFPEVSMNFLLSCKPIEELISASIILCLKLLNTEENLGA